MTRRKTVPQECLEVREYSKLEQFAAKFAEGHFNLLIVLGSAGIAKSQTVKQAVGKTALWIEGSASAFGLYSELYSNQGRQVVIDDVDGLYSDKAAVRLLKQLCQTDEQKTVSWYTAAAGDSKGLPRSFETTSSTIMIANDWKTLSENVYAVQNRGLMIHFNPSLEELHRKTAEWFWDEEVFSWIGANLPILPGLTMRHYVRASQLKEAGMNWFDAFVNKDLSERTLAVAKLKADESFPDEKARIVSFSEMGFGNRTTYFNHAKKLRWSNRKRIQPLDIPLVNPQPGLAKAA